MLLLVSTLLVGISITVGCEMPFVVVDIVAWLACCVVVVAWLASCCFLFKALFCSRHFFVQGTLLL